MTVAGGTPLLEWIDEPRADTGLSYLVGQEWHRLNYVELASLVRRCAKSLAEAHPEPGATVVAITDDPVKATVSFFAALYAGLRPCLVAPPGPLGRDYPSHLEAVARRLDPAMMYADESSIRTVVAAAAGPAESVRPLEDLIEATSELGGARGQDHARILQLTSGSSGASKGVALELATVDGHVDALRRWLHRTADDRAASWLPLYHDMGLIGMVVTSVTAQVDLDLMTPTQFIKNPIRYLNCFSPGGATVSAMPAFALRHIARRVKPERLRDVDVSAMRVLFVGAERVDPTTLIDFEQLMEPHGLSDKALCPAYGMAEATLAVSACAPTERWHARPLGEHAAAAPRAGAGVHVVSCGSPLDDVHVTAVGEDGPVPEGSLGELQVRGPWIGDILGERAGLSDPNVHLTGDAGFVVSGEIYPVGRLGDATKSNGRMVFAEDVEMRLAEAGVDPMRCCALLGYGANGGRAVIVLEQPKPTWVDAATRVATNLFGDLEHEVAVVPMRSIARTSSGKPRRRELWARFAEDG